jgi:hypothetical protein
VLPDSLATLLAFLGLVTPGLTYQFLRERARPALDESAFREASRVALTSAVLTAASLGTLVAFSARYPTWVVSVPAWLRGGGDYVATNPWLVTMSVVAAVLVACVYALLAHVAFCLGQRYGKSRVSKSDVWYQLFVADVPKGKVPWVVVKLNDGTHLWGHVDFFTVGRPLEDRELSLKGPKLAIEEAEGEQEIEDYYSRVNVRALDIALMKVAYEKKAEKKGVRAGEGHAEGRKHGG